MNPPKEQPATSPPFDPASLTELGHLLLRQCVPPHSIVVDGTVGNGHDTLFLAQLVGPKGRVYGFEVQATALVDTLEKCHNQAVDPIPTLFHQGHEKLDECLPESIQKQVRAFVFNLGYLPGSDKQVVSRPESTLSALQSALEWLAPGGVILVTVYRGHKGGEEESRTILKWTHSLPSSEFVARQTISLNGSKESPWQLLVLKRPKSGSTSRKESKP